MPGKPSTASSLTVTPLAPETHTPFTFGYGPGVQALAVGLYAGSSTVPCGPAPAPLRVIPFFVIVTFS